MNGLLICLTLLSLNSLAQSSEEEVKKPINQFFEGMRKSDSNMIKASIAPKAILQTIYKSKEGKTTVRTEEMDKFIAAVTTPHTEVYDERITFEVIKIEADLAIAWTPYQFFIGDKFSHCGVNSFQLVRMDNIWKIQYIIDTRRKDNCNK